MLKQNSQNKKIVINTLSSETKKLVNLVILNLQSENITQDIIDNANNYFN